MVDTQKSRRTMLQVLAGAITGVTGWSSSAFGGQGSATSMRLPAAPFRRVVTGFNAAGKSIITHDGAVPVAGQDCCSIEQIAKSPFLKGVSANEIWLFDKVPFDLSKATDPIDGMKSQTNQPDRAGIIARIVRYEPGVHYPMHTTASIDLCIVISGALELQLETGSTVMRAGEVVVQRATPHAWRVVGNEPVLVVFVLVDAVNGPRSAA